MTNSGLIPQRAQLLEDLPDEGQAVSRDIGDKAAHSEPVPDPDGDLSTDGVVASPVSPSPDEEQQAVLGQLAQWLARGAIEQAKRELCSSE